MKVKVNIFYDVIDLEVFIFVEVFGDFFWSFKSLSDLEYEFEDVSVEVKVNGMLFEEYFDVLLVEVGVIFRGKNNYL